MEGENRWTTTDYLLIRGLRRKFTPVWMGSGVLGPESGKLTINETSVSHSSR